MNDSQFQSIITYKTYKKKRVKQQPQKKKLQHRTDLLQEENKQNVIIGKVETSNELMTQLNNKPRLATATDHHDR